jgi:DNA-binding PadR family transcriptional regulator
LTESTRYAVLGVILQRGSIHGYAVAEELRRWQLGEAVEPNERSIYRALEWLIGEGLAEEREDAVVDLQRMAQTGTSAVQRAKLRNVLVRRLYSATDTGAARFEAWLAKPLSTEIDLSFRLGAARQEDLAVLLTVVRDAEERWARRLRDEPMTDVRALRAPSTPWPESRATLMATWRSDELMGHTHALGNLRQYLEEMTGDARRA